MSREVQQMFARIAGRYDLANDVLSLGIHRFWRRQAVKLSGIGRGAEVLDLCAGTGDQSFSLADTVGREGSVIGLDFVMPMLTLAAAKNGRFSERKVGRAPVTFLQGDAMTLPFADGAFDLVTISFGIRNVDSPVKCLQEIYRVLRPGGRVMVLEFGRPQISWLRYCYDLYSRWIMPTLGGLLSGDRSAYE